MIGAQAKTSQTGKAVGGGLLAGLEVAREGLGGGRGFVLGPEFGTRTRLNPNRDTLCPNSGVGM